MSEYYDAERRAEQQIGKAELKLHRLLASRERIPVEERAVVEREIEAVKNEIRHVKTRLHA